LPKIIDFHKLVGQATLHHIFLQTILQKVKILNLKSWTWDTNDKKERKKQTKYKDKERLTVDKGEGEEREESGWERQLTKNPRRREQCCGERERERERESITQKTSNWNIYTHTHKGRRADIYYP